jgi:hypothetical protein
MKSHQMYGSKPYWVWRNMINRCYNPNAKQYNDYGGRGITVCDEWRNSFECFWNDMKHEYEEGLTINRIDNMGYYCKVNCKWDSLHTQARNKRNNIIVTINGESRILKDWCKIYNINQNTVYSRLNRNWDVIDAITIPKLAFSDRFKTS